MEPLQPGRVLMVPGGLHCPQTLCHDGSLRGEGMHKWRRDAHEQKECIWGERTHMGRRDAHKEKGCTKGEGMCMERRDAHVEN